jgi:hypothetical protein
MSARELFARLTDELLPPATALVVPAAFVLEHPVAALGPHGPQN